MSKAPRKGVLDAAGDLGRAVTLIGAAPVLVPLLLGRDLGTAGRAVRGHHEGALAAVRRSSTGARIPGMASGLAQHDRVADQHALALHVELVVQRGLLDREATATVTSSITRRE